MGCIRGLAYDKKGVLFLAGTLAGTIDLDPGPEKCEFALESSNRMDRMAVVARFAAKDCKLLNAFGFARTSRPVLTRLALDGIGDVYVAGLFGGPLNLDPSKDKSDAEDADRNQAGYFIAKYAPTGKLIWDHSGIVDRSRRQGGRDNTFLGLAVDKRLRVFAAGGFGNDLELKGGLKLKNPDKEYDGVVLRLDSMGKLK